jgi:small subunit ribosomal protein S1
VDQLISGTITKLTNFGAFARVEGSVEGLIHISELSYNMVSHPKEVVKEGDVLTLKILKIEPERKRLALSLKQAEEI